MMRNETVLSKDIKIFSRFRKDIKYTKNNTEFYGTALDIDKDGGLIVKSGNSTTVLKSGEISLYL